MHHSLLRLLSTLLLSFVILISGTNIPFAFATNAFQEDSEIAIGAALNALRAQPVEDAEHITFASKDKWIRSFAFPSSWVATLKTKDLSALGGETKQNFTGKRLKELIYQKGSANVRTGASNIQLYSPLESFVNANAPTPEKLFVYIPDEQILLLRPLQNPAGADQWGGTFLILWITPDAANTLPSNQTLPPAPDDATAIAEYTQSLFSGKVPSARDITTTKGTLFGKESRVFSFKYQFIGVDYRFREETVYLDGAKVELFLKTPETMFPKVQLAQAAFIDGLVVAKPDAAQASSSSSQSSTSTKKVVIPRSCTTAAQKKQKRCQRYYPGFSSGSVDNSSQNQALDLKNENNLVDAVIETIINQYYSIEQPGYKKIQSGEAQANLPNLRSENYEKKRIAIQTLVQSLGDPLTKFHPRTNTNDSPDAKEHDSGIGVLLVKQQDRIFIRKIFSSSPAEWSGLQPGDEIIAVDTISASGMTVDAVENLLQGKDGSSFTLKTRRGLTEQAFSLKRDKNIFSPEISVIWQGKIPMISLIQFGETTVNSFPTVVGDLVKHSSGSLILDLRGNQGGLLEGADVVLSTLIGPGKVFMQFKEKNSTTQKKTSFDQRVDNALRIYVLTDEYTSSAAELVAASLREYARAKIIGRQTAGHTAIYKTVPFNTGDKLDLVVGEWLTMKGLSLYKKGLTPDVQLISEDSEKQVQQVLRMIPR